MIGSLLRSLFIRVPYSIGYLQREPTLQKYPFRFFSEFRKVWRSRVSTVDDINPALPEGP